MPFFDQNHGLTPLEKSQFFDFFELFVFIAQKGGFSFQSNVKDIFLAYTTKKKIRKKGIFGKKPQVNAFGKMSIFQFFKLLAFIAYKGVFFLFQNIITDIFLAYIAKKKNFENWPFFNKNHGLTPLEKSHFFDFLNFLFLQPRKAFIRSRIS